jgi:hypothetical protein
VRWFYTIPLRLRSLFRRRSVELELDEELRDHLQRRIQEGVARGLTPEDARYAALRAMEGIEQRKEECRERRRVNLFEDLLRDLAYAARMLRRSPGFCCGALARARHRREHCDLYCNRCADASHHGCA